MTETHWSKVKVDDGFSDEVKRVVPSFWELMKKEVDDVSKLRKENILTSTESHKTSLPKFLALVLAISKGKKPNTISTRGRRAILERAKKSNSDSLLMEFIKFDKSDVLKHREEESKEKDKLIKDVIEAIGTEIVDQPEWKPVESTIKNLL